MHLANKYLVLMLSCSFAASCGQGPKDGAPKPAAASVEVSEGAASDACERA
ncbi:MAG: hypothetical protein RL701_2972, partial [Pseudomonadota bacterium]